MNPMALVTQLFELFATNRGKVAEISTPDCDQNEASFTIWK